MTGNISNRIFGIKEQLAAEKVIKENGMWDTATNLYLTFQKNQDYVSQYLIALKNANRFSDFERYFGGAQSSVELWHSSSFNYVVVAMVKYWYKRKFETGHSPMGLMTKNEMPTGLMTYGANDYIKKDTSSVTDGKKFFDQILGSFKYQPTKKFRFVFLNDGVWFLSKGVNSYIPYDVFPKLKVKITNFIGKELLFDGTKNYVEQPFISQQEIDKLNDLFKNKDVNNKIEGLDSQLLLNNFYICAEASAASPDEYPTYHELKIDKVNYAVPSIAFFQAVNALQEQDVFTVYYSPTHIITESTNGTFSIIESMATGFTYTNINLFLFKKGLTIRDIERLDVTPPSTIEIPQDLLNRKPIVKTIVDKQRLLTTDIYPNVLNLIFDYINSYTQTISVTEKITTKEEDLTGQEIDVTREILRDEIRAILNPIDESNLNYVYEVEDIYWTYNESISIDELLAYFIIKGKNENYQMLCLKILGIDYMYHYNELLDALIQRGKIMIEHIKVDADTKQLKELQYNYLHLYASGNIYEKLIKLTGRQGQPGNDEHIIEYFGEELGQSIVRQQIAILREAVPETCIPVSDKTKRQLELDLSNQIFWKSDFPLLIRKNGVKGAMLKMFDDYVRKLPSGAILGGLTAQMIKDAYMLPITRTEFIGGWHEGKSYGYILSKWIYKNKQIKIESSSLPDILIALYPHLQKWRDIYHTKGRLAGTPVIENGKPKRVKVGMKASDFIDENAKDKYWMIKEGEEIKKSVEAKYFDTITEIKEEGSKLFNQFIQNELKSSSQQIISDRWNQQFNAYQSPLEFKIPVFMRFSRIFGNDASKKFELDKKQVAGVRFIVSREYKALLAHEVGLGKTLLSLATISHLFETGEVSRIMVLTPKAVRPKFMKEAIGLDDFRGAIPHINLVDLDNAKPKMFLPDFNEKTYHITLDRLKKYQPDDMMVYQEYAKFIKDIEEMPFNSSTFPNEIFEPKEEHIEYIKSQLENRIPKWKNYEFLALLFQSIQMRLDEAIRHIRLDNDAMKKTYLLQKKKVPKEDIAATYFGHAEQFSKDAISEIKSIKNKILDELGEYLPQVMQPKTLIMATHIALEELRPDEQYLIKAANTSDDVDNTSDARTITQRLIKNIGRQSVSFSKLKIDGIVVDEAHNFNELLSSVRQRYVQEVGEENKKVYNYDTLAPGKSEAIGLNVFKYWYKIGNANDRKLTMLALSQQVKSRIMLSATPFTEGPLHALSVMNMVNREKLEEMGYGSAYTFFENYIFEKWRLEPKIETNKVGLQAVVDRYRNMAALCNFLAAFTDFQVGGVELNKRRPIKYIIPDDDDDNMDKSLTRTGINSYVPYTAAQEFLKEQISEYVSGKIKYEEICDEVEEVIEIFEIYNKDKNAKYPLDQVWKGEAKEIEEYLEQNKSQIPGYNPNDTWRANLKRFKLSYRNPDEKDEAEETGSVDAGSLFKDEINAGKRFIRDARMFRAKSLQEKMNISPYYIKCSPSIVKLPSLKGYVQDANGDVEIYGHKLRNAAKNFIENSPKLYYSIGCIASVLTKHQLDGLDKPEWSGQIIYMNMGKSFSFEGVSYNAYELIKEYIVYHRADLGLDEDEVAMIYGGKGKKEEKEEKEEESDKIDPTQQIINDYNSGKIKVLIGSSKIREGIDLQKNSSVMYILQAEYNPTNAIQLEGRIWRQGNRWQNVRIVYVLAYNSIDTFVYSKVKMKIKSVRGIMSAGRCLDLNAIKVYSFDAGEIQRQLTTNPDDNAMLWWQEEDAKMRKQLSVLNQEIQLLIICQSEYPKVKKRYEEYIIQLNAISKMLEEVKYWDLINDKILPKLSTDEHALIVQGQQPKTRAERVKIAEDLIATGVWKKIYEHRVFTTTMSYNDFQSGLDKIKSIFSDTKVNNFTISSQNEARKNMVVDIKETHQTTYWKTLINIGFTDYDDWVSTTDKYSRSGEYDEVLSSFTRLVTTAKNPDGSLNSREHADISDIIEDIQNKQKAINDRINDRENEINAKKKIFIQLMEDMKLAGAFDIQTQIDAFASTNNLLVLRPPNP